MLQPASALQAGLPQEGHPRRHLASVSSRASDVTYDGYLLKLLSGLWRTSALLPETVVCVEISGCVSIRFPSKLSPGGESDTSTGVAK